MIKASIKSLALLLIGIIIFTNKGMCQVTMPALDVNRPEAIKGYVSKYFDPGDNFSFNACVNVVIYARYKISRAGKIDSLYVTSTGPLELRNALKKAILTTDGLWKMTDAEKRHVGETMYLLPVICYYQSGCFPGVIDSLPSKTDASLLIKSKQADNMLRNSLSNMMVFENGKFQTLNCVLISPIIFGSRQ